MPGIRTKAFQQEVVADFIYGKKLELCMFVYLDAFIDIHRKKHPDNASWYDRRGITALLEASYEKIREDILACDMLTSKAAGKYMMTLKR